MEALYLLTCVGLGLLVVTAFLLGLAKILKSLGSAMGAGARKELESELSEKIVANARDLSKLDFDSRHGIHKLLGLLHRHPDPERAIRQAQVALGPLSREIAEPAAEIEAEEAERAEVATDPVAQPRPEETQRSTVGTDAMKAADEPVAAPEPIAAATPETPRPAPAAKARPPAATAAEAPETPSGRRAAPPSGPVVSMVKERWLDLDNITLLLYVGAALVVIAAGIFVGSSWDAISPIARWGVVTLAAGAFFVVGEAFVRRSRALARAGETFRALGIVLLPFSALAYDEFVLGGEGSAAFWLGVTGLLAGVYYALFRWISAGRLTAYLASISVGVFALLLPDVLDLGGSWIASSLLVASGAMLAIAWNEEPDVRSLATRLPKGAVGPIAESHMIVGVLLAGLSLVGLDLSSYFADPGLADVVYTLLLGGWLVGAGVWLRSRWPFGAAALLCGFAAFQIGEAAPWSGAGRDWFRVAAWSALALALFAVGPRAERRAPLSSDILTTAAVVWGVVAWIYALLALLGPAETRTDGLLVLASAALAVLLVALARRHAQPIVLAPAAVLLHVMILDVLRLLPAETDSRLGPTIIWLALAAFWLWGTRRGLPEWASRFWPAAFVAEAVWATAFSVSDYPSMLVAGLGLTAGWAVWTWLQREPLGTAAAWAQALYALLGLALLVDLPADLLPFAVLVLALTVVASLRLVPQFARIATEIGAWVVVALAPWFGYVVAAVTDLEPGVITLAQSSQLTLLLAAAASAWRALRRSSKELAALAATFAFVGLSWVAVDYVPVDLIPFAALAIGLATIAAARRAPGESAKWLDVLGIVTVVVAPWTGYAAAVAGGQEPIIVTMAQSSQLTLLLSSAAGAWYAMRGDSEELAAISAALAYVGLAWIAVDYVPVDLIPPAALALGLLTTHIARHAPGASAKWLDVLGIVTVIAAPWAGYYAAQAGGLEPTLVTAAASAQTTLLLSAAACARWALLRASRELAAVTAALAYVGLAWIAVDYVPVDLIPPAALALGLLTTQIARHAPGASAKWLDTLGIATVVIAPWTGYLASDIGGVEPALVSITQSAQLTLLLAATASARWAMLRASERQAAMAAALAYLAIAWVAVTYVPIDLIPPAMLALGLVTTFIARQAPGRSAQWLDHLGIGTVIVAPWAGYVASGLAGGDASLISLAQSAQLTMLVSTAVTAWWALQRTSEALAAVATTLAYICLSWVALDYLPVYLLPLAAFGLGLATMAAAPQSPGRSAKWLDVLAVITVIVAPLAGGVARDLDLAAIQQASTVFLGSGLNIVLTSQMALLLAAVTLGARGRQEQRRELLAIAGVQTYVLYAWILAEGDVSAVQAYTAPLGLLLLAMSALEPKLREAAETAAVSIVLVPAALQAGVNDALGYTLLLGLWGLALIAVGVSLERRILLAAGVAGVLLAALRQLWEMVAMLPPGFVVGIVGLTLMAIAVVLTWRRDVVRQLGRRGTEIWDQMGQDEAG